MWMIILIFILALVVGGLASANVEGAQGCSGCLLMFGGVLFIIFFLGSCAMIL